MEQKYDWTNIDPKVNWIATDSYTKTAQGHSAKPKPGFDRWVSNSIKYWLHLPGWLEGHWEDSLEQRPLEIKNET